eukprot:TRINITY_DN11315_c0_g1_i1.p1 TRINITY_DN11315_c0_g1~~TRINITY_DN11315_c0_g1_i1.p1  ORF type:complete len:243 (-),score=65.75 TRINITY_DN11315_c0_g1_i1:43-771(-)
MGISRDSKHKRRNTGGKRKIHRKKRKYELGRPAAMTRLGTKRIHLVRCRGGMIKHRALKLDHGNFSWASEAVAKQTRILVVVYNASNNELVRTNTLVKNSIIQIDATPFRAYYEQRYGVTLGKAKKESASTPAQPKAAAASEQSSQPAAASKKDAKKSKKDSKAATPAAEASTGPVTKSDSVKRKQASRRRDHPELDQHLADQFSSGRLYACIASRPGQSGRADGYILEGEELAFYLRKLKK